MLATVQDFRARLYQDITLPSGLVVRIRAVTAQDFLGIGELPLPNASPGDAPVSLDDLVFLRRYTHRAIARGVIAPPMTDVIDDGGHIARHAEVLHVQELYDCAPDDYVALAQAINQRAGLTQEVAQAVDTFRADALGEAIGSPGGEIPPAAVGAADDDARRALFEPENCGTR